MKNEFPEFYPCRLKKISWSLNDGAIVGPHKYWNKYLDESEKQNKDFVRNVLISIFVNQKISITNEVKELIGYILKCFSVVYKAEAEEFSISPKKDKETKKALFDTEKWYDICGAFGYKKASSTKLLKFILKELTDYYNQMLIEKI